VWSGNLPGDTSPNVSGDPSYVHLPNGKPGTVELIDPFQTEAEWQGAPSEQHLRAILGR
jgi:hypothetical protein